MRTLVLRILFAVYLVVVGVIVWTPVSSDTPFGGPIGVVARWLTGFGLPLAESYTVLEVAANVVMFLPFGALAMTAFRWTRVWSTTLAGLATSGLIEGVQLFLPTRYSTVSDLVANTSGALLGALAVAWARRRALSAAASRPS
ncbi:VanZ family protein [Protaetiibacter larvae]|nr:VanZ family protein [Protaetiibacter larvae]